MTIALAPPASPPASLGDVRGALQVAILRIWCDDSELFFTRTHERTIMFYVGRRLVRGSPDCR